MPGAPDAATPSILVARVTGLNAIGRLSPEFDRKLSNRFGAEQRGQRAGAFAVPFSVDFARAEMALEGGDDGFERNVRVRRKAVAEAGEVLRCQFPHPALRADLPRTRER